MLKIWGRTNSLHVKKALWCAQEIGIPYERIDAGGQYGLVKDAPYRALNPNSLIPTLEDGELILWESNTIVRYLASQYGATAQLCASQPSERAKQEMWMDWVTSSVTEPHRLLFWNTIRLAPQDRNPQEAEQGMRGLSDMLAIADQHLSIQPYLAGNHFSMADIPLGCIAYSWFGMPIQRPAMPHLRAWYERLAQRPAYQKSVMIPLT